MQNRFLETDTPTGKVASRYVLTVESKFSFIKLRVAGSVMWNLKRVKTIPVIALGCRSAKSAVRNWQVMAAVEKGAAPAIILE